MNKGLTERESEILLWASQGNRNNEIATILGISTATVRKHMEHTLLKFECENRGFATQQAVQMIEDATGGCLSYKCMTCALPHCRNCVSYS
jgi:DNA-binding CsgD family transcriptional regulator